MAVPSARSIVARRAQALSAPESAARTSIIIGVQLVNDSAQFDTHGQEPMSGMPRSRFRDSMSRATGRISPSP